LTRIKAHKNYTAAMGQDLQIIGAQIVLDRSSWKPVATVQYDADLLSAGKKAWQGCQP